MTSFLSVKIPKKLVYIRKMDNSIRPTIEKIKLKEQEEELRLKEKREYNDAIMSLNRAIHDTSTNIDKLTKEYQTLISTTDKLQNQLIIEKSRHTAFSEQIDECRKELDTLQKASASGISAVWEKRSKLFETVQNTSNACDIWALLIKPNFEITTHHKPQHKPNSEEIVVDDTRLKAAFERKNKAIAMRNSLLTEPEVGEEFVRTRNALQYSLEIMANEQKN